MIRASPEHIFAYLARVEHLPRYGAPLWMTAEPVEKRGQAQVVVLSGYFVGLPVESVQRVALRPPTSLEVSQIRGTLRAFAGHCTLTRGEDGTEVVYRLEVDPGIPMVTDDSARQCLVQYLTRLLDRIKLAAERKAPVRRAPGPAAAAPEAQAVSASGSLEPEPEEEPAPPAGQEDRPEAPAAALADVHEPVRAASAPPPEAAVSGRPAPQGRSPGAPGQRPAAEASSGGRRRRHRRRRRRHRGGAPGAPGAPRPPAP